MKQAQYHVTGGIYRTIMKRYHFLRIFKNQ